MNALARHIPIPDGALRAGQHQLIALGSLAQGLLDPFAFGDITHRRHPASAGRSRRNCLAVRFDDDARAVLAQHDVLDDALAALPDAFHDPFAVFGNDQFLDEPSHELLDRIARQARELLVAVEDAAALADDDALEGGGGKQRQPLFALAQSAFVEYALADIAQDDGEEPAALHLDLGNGSFHLEDLAIGPPAMHTARAGQLAAAYPGTGEGAHLSSMPLAGLFGQQRLDGLAEGFGSRQAEHQLGCRIELHDPMAVVHADDGLHGRLDQARENLFALARFSQRLAQLLQFLLQVFGDGRAGHGGRLETAGKVWLRLTARRLILTGLPDRHAFPPISLGTGPRARHMIFHQILCDRNPAPFPAPLSAQPPNRIVD